MINEKNYMSTEIIVIGLKTLLFPFMLIIYGSVEIFLGNIASDEFHLLQRKIGY